jgi:hypothetical protein
MAISIAIGHQGTPHIVFAEHLGGSATYLKYAHWNGSAWDIQILDSGYVEHTGLFLDRDDRPHVVYYILATKSLRHTYWNGTSWNTQTIGSERWFAIHPDAQGNIHLAIGTGGGLHYRIWDGLTWIGFPQPEVDTVSSQWLSLDLDTANRPYISYYDATNQDLKYAHWTGSTWVTQTLESTVESRGVTGMFSSLALDADGNPHILYIYVHDGETIYDQLRYAWWDGNTWTYEQVGTAAPRETSLAFDDGGTPHIAFGKRDSGSPMYGCWQGGSWNLQNVDPTASGVIAMVLDAEGNPHLGYAHWDNRYYINSVRYAAGHVPPRIKLYLPLIQVRFTSL